MLGDSLRRRHGPDRGASPEPRPRPPRPKRGRGLLDLAWWQWLLTGLGVLVVSFGIGYLLSTQVLFPRPDTAGTGIPVPSLYGETRAEAEAALRAAGLIPGDVTELASLEVERGRVLAQAPIPDQQLRSGAVVSFAVSGGPPVLRVPPVRGMTEEAARDLLESVGFEVEVRQVRGADVPGGAVARTDPEPGVARSLPAVVTVLVNTAPPVDSLQGDLPLGEPTDGDPTDGDADGDAEDGRPIGRAGAPAGAGS